jgi:hypothetical protein
MSDIKAEESQPFYSEMNTRQSVGDYNKNTRNLMQPIEVRYSYFNHKIVWDEILNHKSFDMSVEHKKHVGEPAIIVSSGPSFDDAGELYRKWKGAIFASTSQASTLDYYGRKPDYIVAIDARTKIHELDPIWRWKGSKTTLCLHPCIDPNFHKPWPARKLYFRAIEPSSVFFTQLLPAAYDCLPTQMYLFACTPAAQLSLATFMGYNPIFLYGCDFGFPRDQARFTRHWWSTKNIKVWPKFHGPWGADASDHLDHRRHQIVHGVNGVPSYDLHVYYKRSFLCVSRIDLPDIIDCSAGILDEFPKADPKEVIAKQGKGFEHLFLTREKKIDILDKYLATQNTYTVEFANNAIKYVETTDPTNNLEGYMNMMLQAMKQDDPEAEKQLDVQKNMTRIREIKAWRDAYLLQQPPQRFASMLTGS